MHPLNLNPILIPLKCSIIYKKKLPSTKSSYFSNMLGSYGISSKQAYKLSFTLVGKTPTNQIPNQHYLVIFPLFI